MNKTGNQKPTLRKCPKYNKTEGALCVELANSYGLPPLEWQADILKDWLAVDDNGKLINNVCVLEVPRQNGKTGASDPRETWGLIYRREQILHTAQEFQTAKKAFDRLRKKFGMRKNDPYAEYPELNALVERYTVSAGQMALDLINGGHIEFRTRGNNSDMGRGGTFDLVVIDEAQAYTEEQDAALSPLNSAAPTGSPQTILMGTPPSPHSGNKGAVFLKSIKNIKAGNAKHSCLHLWGVDDVGDVSDKERWYLTNPSLGFHLLIESLEKDAATMSPDVFAREHLGYIATRTAVMDFAISADVWDACGSDDRKPEGKTAYGVKFSADGSEVVLCGAVIPKDGKARISLIERQPTGRGVKWLADWLNARYMSASCVVIDGRNGVDVLIDKMSDVWRAKGSVIRPSYKDLLASVGMLTDALNEQSITWYRQQDELRDSAITATKRPLSGGWVFGGSDACPIDAAALAYWGARTSKRDSSKVMRIG